MSIKEFIQNHTNNLLNYIYPAKEQPQTKAKPAKPSITIEQATAAAKYWGDFLPGIKEICFSDINKYSKIDTSREMQTMSIMHKIARDDTITLKQYNLFVDILAKKIFTKELHGKSVQLGDRSQYEPAKEIQEAIIEAGLQLSAFGLMPYKTQMNIYTDGHTEINHQIVDLTQEHTGCADTKSYKELYNIKLQQLDSAMNPHHPDIPDLSAKLAIVDLSKKCEDSQYDDSYSKDKLVEHELYPWNLEDSSAAVEALCGLLYNPQEL